MTKEVERVVVSFSGGQTSAYMTTRLLEMEKRGEVIVEHICFCNTGMEHEATLRFVNNCEELWGRKVTWLEYAGRSRAKQGEAITPLYNIVDYSTAARNGEPFERLILEKACLPCQSFRFCTSELKVMLIEYFLTDRNQFDLRQAIGIRADEPSRYYKISNQENKFMPLFKWGVTKQMVNDFWDKQPFKLEVPNRLGNCTLCFLKGKLKRVAILREFPELAEWWIKMEDKISSIPAVDAVPKKIKTQIKKTPEHEAFLLAAKLRPKNNTFDKQYSVRQLLALAKSQLDITDEMLEGDVDIACACNVD